MLLAWNLEYFEEKRLPYRTDRTQKQHFHQLPEYLQPLSVTQSKQSEEEEVRNLGELHQTNSQQIHEDFDIYRQLQLSDFKQ